MIEKIKYYFWSTYRRRIVDKMQQKYSYLYKGVVLDVGGRDRGFFEKPKDKIEKWIFADIEKRHNPDVVLDVSNMKELSDNSIDVINAIDLFEHVKDIEKGLDESFRVLKKGGNIIISVPFLYQVHADPYDYQRWTKDKWILELENRGFKIEKLEIQGYIFTLLGDILKTIIKSFPIIVRHLFYLFYPLIDFIVYFDNLGFIKINNKLSKFHGGYYIIGKK